MATYTGTSNDDTFNGTTGADTFDFTAHPGGVDTANGDTGTDTLKVDYSTLTGSDGYGFSTNIYGDTDWIGFLRGGLNDYTYFSGIEKLTVKLSSANDYVSIDATPLGTAGNTISVNAGAGTDYLSIDLRNLSGSTFSDNGSGTVTGNRGSYAGFEAYTIQLGGGTNTVKTAGGDDTIYSNGGTDSVDGGAGYDYWYASYGGATTNLALAYDFTTLTGSLGAGTLKNLEYISAGLGSGNDSVTMRGYGSANVDGGAGTDSLKVDNSGLTDTYYSYSNTIYSDGSGGFYGNVGTIGFGAMEKLDITLGDTDDYVNVNPTNLASAGTSLKVNGGLGSDTLQADFTALGDTTFIDNGDGTVTSNHGSYAGFEAYRIHLGGGTNTVTTGAGDDQVYSYDGTNDSIDGGSGSDYWYGYLQNRTDNLTFSYDFTTLTGSLGAGVLKNLEYTYVNAGSGDDSFTVRGFGGAELYGNGGIDSLTINQSGLSNPYYYYSNYIYSDGAGGFYGNSGGTNFNGMEKVDVTLGDTDDNLYVSTGSLANPDASLKVNGGAGYDTLQADFTALGGTTFIDNGDGTVISNQGSYAGFEAYRIYLGGGANTVTTGAGDDTVVSYGGTNDNIDGGEGNDYWYGYLQDRTDNLTFSYDFSTLTGSLGAGTLKNLEYTYVNGGSGDDSFAVRGFGGAQLLGNGGIDELTINQSGLSNPYYYYSNYIYSDGSGGFYGNSGGTSFDGMEKVDVTLGDTDDYLYLNTGSLANPDASLKVNGGAGYDYLQADFTALGGTTFIDNGDGTVTSNQGSYAGFEAYRIYLGGGANTVTTGAGDDQVYSYDGTNDSIDGGEGNDYWYGYLQDRTDNLTFSYDFSTLTGSLGAGTLKNLEYTYVNGGSGDDSFAVRGFGGAQLNGNGGTDSLIINQSSLSNPYYSYYYYSNYIYSDGSGGFYGNSGGTSFNGMEKVDVTLGDTDDYLYLNTGSLANPDASLKVNGGAGYDTLQADFTALGNATFIDNGDGTVTSNQGSYAGFERYVISLGGGTNAVTTGAGDDQVYSYAGTNDSIDGGDGYDYWHGYLQDRTDNLTFSYDFTTLTGALGAGTLKNLEYTYLNAGSGDDSFTVRGFGSAQLNGNGGTDSLIIDNAGQTGSYYWYNYIYSDGVGGFYGNVNNSASFYSMEKLDVTYSDDNNYLYVDASSTLSGATLKVNGGLGEDTVQVSGNYAGYSVVQDGKGGYVITDTDASDGDYGSFTVKSFEHAQFNDQVIDLPAYGNGENVLSAASVAENSTAVTTVPAGAAGASPTYEIVDGADAALFTVDAATGALSFKAAPNFEAPGDVGGNNIYDVVVKVTGGSGVYTNTIAVSVTNVNEAPAFVSAATASVEEGQTYATNVQAVDPEGTAPTYSISGGADAARFTIDAATGALSFKAAPSFASPSDAGGNNVYDVVVRASDGTLFTEQAVAITVTKTTANQAPAFAAASLAVSVAENTTAAATVHATDPDGNALTYTISGGADAALFQIDASTGALSFKAAPDFEAPGDAGGNNVYDVVVRASDGSLFAEQAVAVTVTNANENPFFANASVAVNVAENATAVTTVHANDTDASTTLVYSISGGADASLFQIDATTGALSFKSAPNFEAPGDAGANNVYDVIVRASDGALFGEQAVAVTVTNVNEAPAFAAASVAVNVAENTTAVTTVSASDPDAGASVTYSISGGADAALFKIDAATGALAFKAAPDFEAPGDVGANNVYDVVVRASDGSLFAEQSVAVTVTNVNEAPSFAAATKAVNVAENTTPVVKISGSDPDGGTTLTYSISGGADASLFKIDAATGELAFKSAPNFEAPGDAGGNNVYDVVVRASDGSLFAEQAVAVTVTDTNEAPTFASASKAISVAENGTSVTTISAGDPDAGTTLSYSISGGADAALFKIDAATGALSFKSAPDFEAPGDAGANNVYDVVVRASDGSLFAEQSVAVTVTNVNEAPTIVSASSVSVIEGASLALTVQAEDPDAGTTLAYSIAGGADASLFTIDAVTGALSFKSAPVFASPTDAGGDNVYDVVVRASDGTLFAEQAVSIGVTKSDANQAPAFAAASLAVDVAENTTAAGTVHATDPDGNTLAYSIVGGSDASLFTIDAATGALAFKTAPNFEAAGDAGGNNVYDVVVRASDGSLFAEQSVAVTVTNVNENPAFAAASVAVNVAENTTSVTTVQATDPDGGTGLAYSISGGADAALFQIDAATGALSFKAAPNFEAPGDAGGNNVYDVVVRASDGSLFAEQAVAVTVNNVNEAPVFGAGALAVAAFENETAVTTVFASDPDAGTTLSFSISGGADAALFTIDATTGALSFKNAPNFEAPGDAGGDNTYNVVVRASDGSLFADQAVSVTMNNVNEAPSVTSAANVSVVEGTVLAATVKGSDPDAGTTLSFGIAGGADADLFTIDTVTGALSFKSALSFASPADAGANNVYDVIVLVSDGTLSATRAMQVTVTAAGGIVLNPINGTSGNDRIGGTASGDLIDGGAGDDRMAGRAGDDTYVVDSVGDRVIEKPGEGNDTVRTSLASYTLDTNVENLVFTTGGAHNGTGNGADNHLTGNSGDDVLDGRAGADTMEGGAGNDLYYVDNAGDVVVEVDGGGTDSVIATVNYTLADNVENLTLAGGKASVTATGNAGNNVIVGNGVANVILGLDGDDTLIGGGGNDSLTGGAGSDTFVFTAAPSPNNNLDTVTDFVSGEDHLAFSKAAFAGLGVEGVIDAGQFWSGAGVTKAHDADDRFIYNTTTGALYFDADGNGTGSKQVLVAILSGAPALDYSDVLIVA